MAHPLLLRFTKYTSIGVLNTALHWLIFYGLLYAFSAPQAWANLAGFLAAASFSFVVNARVTFKAQATKARYFLFVTFMACISFSMGWLADYFALPSLLTLVAFSGTSLVLGFLFSNYIVFRK